MKQALIATTAVALLFPATADADTVSTTFIVPVTAMATTLPMIYPPPSPFAVVYPTATVGNDSGRTTFAITGTSYLYPVNLGISVRWHNVTTGAAGIVEISTAPIEVDTGRGRVFATATLAPTPWAVNVTPGFGTFEV